MVLVALTLSASSKRTDHPATREFAGPAALSRQKSTGPPSWFETFHSFGFGQDNAVSHFELTSLSVRVT